MNDTSLRPGIDGRTIGTPWLRPELVAPPGEILAVVTVVIGPFAARSAWTAWQGSSSHYLTLLLDDTRLLTGLFVEGALLAALLGFLYRRGWTPSDFKIKPGWLSCLQGVALFIAVTIGNTVTVSTLLGIIFALQTTYHTLIAFVMANSPHLQHHSVRVSWSVLVAAMVLNAFFEEMTCMGYAFNQFAARRGPFFALLLTVLLRMSCHTYQGPVHMLGIGVVFTIFGLWYWRTRNLWPLIAGHALLDLFSTALLKFFFS